MKYFLIILMTAFILYSCKKDKNSSNSHTIKGSFVNCNNGISTYNYNNTAIDLFQQSNGSNNNSKVLANTTSDSQGNFSFTYSTTNVSDKLIIRTSTGFGFFRIIEGIPIGDLPNLRIRAWAYNLVANLQVIKPYTNSDTLFYGRPDIGTDIKIAGPFVTERLFKIINAPLKSTLYYESNIEYIPFRINDPFGQFTRKEYAVNNSSLCSSDTVYVNIDVR